MAKSKTKNKKTQSEKVFREGTVICSTGSWYNVRLNSGELIEARMRGKIRLKGFKSTNPVAVGDHVTLEQTDEDWHIKGILPRRNFILRKSINLSKRVHILCANIDQALILFTLDQPITTVGYVDRLLLSCEAYDVTPIIVFNKIDLLQAPELKNRLEELENTYSRIGYKTIRVNAQSQEYAEVIRGILKDKVSFVVGRSGTGKSTLVNLADNSLNLKTGELSDYSGWGKHTTTYAEMFPLQFGGYIIDSPGFREMELYGFKKEEISHFFPEMRKYLNECRFNNCLHDSEPGCRIKEAVESGDISESRYGTYLTMLATADGEMEI